MWSLAHRGVQALVVCFIVGSQVSVLTASLAAKSRHACPPRTPMLLSREAKSLPSARSGLPRWAAGFGEERLRIASKRHTAPRDHLDRQVRV